MSLSRFKLSKPFKECITNQTFSRKSCQSVIHYLLHYEHYHKLWWLPAYRNPCIFAYDYDQICNRCVFKDELALYVYVHTTPISDMNCVLEYTALLPRKSHTNRHAVIVHCMYEHVHANTQCNHCVCKSDMAAALYRQTIAANVIQSEYKQFLKRKANASQIQIAPTIRHRQHKHE